VKAVLILNGITNVSERFILTPVNGSFQMKVSLTGPTYMYLTDGENYIYGMIEPNDDIKIKYDAINIATSMRFEGKGCEKFIFRNWLAQARVYTLLKEQIGNARSNEHPFDYLFNWLDSMKSVQLKKLESLKNFMSKQAFDLFYSDVTASFMGNRFRSVGMVYHESNAVTLEKRGELLTDQSRKIIQNNQRFEERFYYSSTYVNEVYNILFVHYDGLLLEQKVDGSLIKKYEYLDSLLPLKLKQPVLTLFLESDLEKMNQAEELEIVIQKTYATTQDTIYRNYITGRLANIRSFRKGMPAPPFTLENEKGEKVSLENFAGKVVYMDFWYGACGACHALFQTMDTVKKMYASNENVVFLYVSIDPAETWKKAIRKYDIKGYHLFTENKGSDHPIITAYKVAGYPTTCIIDKKGRIFSALTQRYPEELKQAIEGALKE